jgi:hypothetical protein
MSVGTGVDVSVGRGVEVSVGSGVTVGRGVGLGGDVLATATTMGVTGAGVAVAGLDPQPTDNARIRMVTRMIAVRFTYRVPPKEIEGAAHSACAAPLDLLV